MHSPVVCSTQTDITTQEEIKNFNYLGIASQYTERNSHRSLWSSFVSKSLVVALLLCLLPAISYADQVTLQWDPNNPTPEGYCVYQRQPGGTYDYSNPVWPTDGTFHTETSCTITGLTEGVTYNFVVRAHVGSDFSENSNEVTYQVPIANTPPQNQSPVAQAGNNLSVQTGASVTIDGSGSHDPDGDSITYQWVQSSGPTVTLSGNNTAYCTFTAPDVSANTTLSFELTVTDAYGQTDLDTCLVLVSPTPSSTDNDNDGIPDEQDPDDDNDGMPDVWEVQYGLDPLSNDADGDADNDGVSNYQEFQSGTNPVIHNGNQAPLSPSITSPFDGESDTKETLWLRASAFEDPNPGDSHHQTQWQVSMGQLIVMDQLMTGKNLTMVKVPRMVLDPSTQYTVRVRYFDSNGKPSLWSNAVTFTTAQDAKDQNNNRVPDDQEVSTHTDMNSDGMPDINQEYTIKSVHTFDNQYLIGVSIDNSTNATQVECAASVDPMNLETPPPADNDMSYGLLGYKIQVANPGDSAISTIYLSDPIGAQANWACYDSVNGWRDCSGTTTVESDGFVVERTLQDGGAEDADGTANGVIVDLSGPGAAPSSVEGSNLAVSDGGSAASGGGGGGGCFIGALFGRK